MAPGDTDSSRSLKRRKVAESCKVCRAKKTRCDGHRPVCSPCKAKGVTCEYNDATIPVSTTTLSDIEARLRRLENQATSTPSDGPQHEPSPLATREGQHDYSARASNFQGGVSSGVHGLNSESEGSFADHPTTRFLRDMTQIGDNQSNTQPQVSTWRKTEEWSTNILASSTVVPKRDIADDLLDCYETFVYPLFPILHMPSFRKRYNHTWEPQSQNRFDTKDAEVCFYATLNIVFALGSLNSSQVELPLRRRSADSFYQRARELLPLDTLDTPSLEVVQCLLLTTVYLSFTKYTNRCHNTLAVAIRIAQTLEFHTAASLSENNQIRREMSKRIWYHCLTLERLLSSVFGRKALVDRNQNSPALPEPVDDEYLLEDGMGTQPVGTPSILEAFVVSIKIFEVITGAQKINYGSLTDGLRLPELVEVLQLNEKIDEIENSLPPHLQYGHDTGSGTTRQRVLNLQAEAVKIRILHIRLILLRPNVLASARHSLTSNFSKPTSSHIWMTLRIEVSTMCVQIAISAIDTLHANLHSTPRLFSAMAVFVTLSAATVIIAASLVPELDVNLEESNSPYGDAVTKAIQVLDEHHWEVEGACEAKGQIEKFLKTAEQAKKLRIRSQPDPSIMVEETNGLLPSTMEDAIGEFDFSDPLWSYQLGAPTSLFSMPEPVDLNGFLS